MATRSFRFDLGQLKKAKLTSQGYLKADALATRSGIFLYKRADGSVVREFRPDTEVFHQESLESLAAIPLTNDHPQQPLTADNTKHLQVGFTGSVVGKHGKHVKAEVTVTDKTAIDDVMSGRKVELSGGYTCDVDWTPGVHDGMSYDAVQRNIRYNHLAIVKEGRAGPEARIKLDAWRCDGVSDVAEMVEDDVSAEKKDSEAPNVMLNQEGKDQRQVQKGENFMAKLKIDSVEYDLPDAVATFISKKDSEVAGLKGEVEKLAGKCDAMGATITKMETDAKKAKDEDEEEGEDKEKKMSKKDGIAYGREFAAVESFAKSVIGKDFKSDGKEIVDMKREVVQKLNPSAKLDGRGEGYIGEAFDFFKENHKPAANKRADSLESGLGGVRTDATDANQSRMDYMERTQNRYLKPIGSGDRFASSQE